ncbi:uncharacterized protein N7515_009322 [Penicillium bovifimosum]|uniref:Pyridoxamine 5'-phosphate oxidase Alr4036 family FMN-binding domain-containing protein n=1 Tax=Penicillium bovifimosum TaxID=126998 RepID=A0A9W9GJG6_9EURO|nr:uncharacterized protein N7515_009322 [Penicillium bovifimosum]KAJ5121361.1 hypothetical protein N7515_009322 [Penicillium bovifimosum]
MSKPSGSSKPAPWRHLLDSHLKQTPDWEFTIATVAYDAQQRPVPRLRTCGCRGFFPELDLHPKGQEAMDQQVKDGCNPPVFESDMLCFTTDARMEKLPQLESSGHAIEAVFWLKDLMTQWRIKGIAYAIGEPNWENEQQEEASRAEIMKSLRVKGGNGQDVEGWTWENAVTKYFANHSPVARVTDTEMACPKCKAQKKRCTHLNNPAPAPTPAAMPATPLRTPLSREAKTTHAHAHGKEPSPAPDNDAVPSDAEKKGAAAATRHPRVSELNPPPFPEDTLEAACALDVHTTFVKELQNKLDEYEEKVTAANEACVALRASANAVQHAMDTWVATWMASDL